MALFRRKNKTTAGGGGDGLPPQSSYAPRAADLTVGDYANGMPNIALAKCSSLLGVSLYGLCLCF